MLCAAHREICAVSIIERDMRESRAPAGSRPDVERMHYENMQIYAQENKYDLDLGSI